MIRLSYLSHASRDISDEELGDILKSARRKNTAADITGMLIYENRTFLQILEGPERNVQACFDVISKDDRHDGVTVLQTMTTDNRMFGDWSMGYADPAALPLSERQNVRSLVQIAADLRQKQGADPTPETRRVAKRIESFLERMKTKI